MRFLGFTLILALLAILMCGLAGWQWTRGNFDSVFGTPPTELGARIYSNYSVVEKKVVPSFTPSEVKYIRVSQNSVRAEFALGEHGWQCIAPWKDRMDPRAAVEIINFTLGMRVEDVGEVSEIDPQKAGLKENAVNIRLEGENHEPLAKYKLGRLTPWLATFQEIETPVPTVFVQTRDPGRKNYIYSCTGDIGPWFTDGLRLLRDHRPFYFNPLTLRQIRILNGPDELTLARETPVSPWRITKPQELATDPKAVKALLEGLYQLRARKVSDRASVTLAPPGTLTKPGQIAIARFGPEGEPETVLEIFPAEAADSREVRATVSDRLDTVFDLPLKPEPDTVSLADIPRAINDLRDSALINLNRASLRGVLIQPANGQEILISRTPPSAWMTTIDGQSQPANEERLFTLLQTMMTGRAISFPTDAATDFTPWGLDKPFLKLQFLGQEGQPPIVLSFGLDGKGGYFVNRLGTTTVMKVDQTLVSSLPVKAFEWRDSRLWALDRNNLTVISRRSGNQPPLTLLYDGTADEWTANSNAKDLTAQLIPARASFMLGVLEGLKVTRWLSPEDASANEALLAPSLAFKIIENTTDDRFNVTGQTTLELRLAPGSKAPNPAFHYGRLGADGQPFLLDRDHYQKLATELLEVQ
jgi:Domain of unknown function (DUF4340)